METPHYLYTLRNDPFLEREGMITVRGRTDGNPLVFGNLLTVTSGETPDVSCVEGDGCMTGAANGAPFAFSTRPGSVYRSGGFETDAVALTGGGETVFAALCTLLKKDGTLLVKSALPITCEFTPGRMNYCL